MKLHGIPLSGHTHRVQLFLGLLGIPYEFAAVDPAGGANRTPAFLAMSPFGEIPAPTLADVAAFSYIAHAPEGGVSLKPYPRIRAWLDQVRALPGFVAMPATTAGVAPEVY